MSSTHEGIASLERFLFLVGVSGYGTHDCLDGKISASAELTLRLIDDDAGTEVRQLNVHLVREKDVLGLDEEEQARNVHAAIKNMSCRRSALLSDRDE